jgi:hypothetical protein
LPCSPEEPCTAVVVVVVDTVVVEELEPEVAPWPF